MVAWYRASIKLVLAKMMEAAKEIRPGDKKREGGPPRLGAGRLVPFSGGRRDKEGGPAAGAMTAAISGGGNLRRMAGKNGDI